MINVAALHASSLGQPKKIRDAQLQEAAQRNMVQLLTHAVSHAFTSCRKLVQQVGAAAFEPPPYPMRVFPESESSMPNLRSWSSS